MPGGGGWGDPLEREPEAVARDVLDEKVSRGAAPASTTASSSTARRVDVAATRGAARLGARAPRRACGMKITRIEATPLAIPLAQEFHWAGGAQVGANLVLFTVHTDEGVVGYGESICEDPRAVAALRRADGAPVRRPLARRCRGDPALDLDARAAGRCSPQFTQLVVAGHRGRLLGRARPGARRPDANVLRRARPRRGRLLRLPAGRRPGRRSRAHARELAARGLRGDLPQGRPRPRATTRPASRRCARRSAPSRCCGSTRTRRGTSATAVDRIRRLEQYDLDWVEQPTPAGDVNGPRARAPLGRT